MTWILGSISQSETLTSNDDLYETHINQLRVSNPPTAVVGTDTYCQYVADGTADDVQIQQAIDYANSLGGGWVHIRRDTYNLAATLNLYSNIMLTGEGWGTILRQTAGANLGKIITGSVDGTEYTNIRIANLQIDGNYSNQDYSGFASGASKGSGIAHNRFSDSIFENLLMKNCGMYGDLVLYGDNVRVKNCTLIDSVGNISYAGGIFLTGVASLNTIIEGCEMSGHAAYCITYEDLASRVKILNNYLHDSRGGIAGDGDTIHKGITIRNNHIYSNSTFGVSHIYSSALSENILIDGNEIYLNTSGGIRYAANHAQISKNIVYNNGTGIQATAQATDYEVFANICYDDQGTKTQVSGIDLATSTDYMDVYRNILRNNKTNSLLNNSTGTHNSIGPNILS